MKKLIFLSLLLISNVSFAQEEEVDVTDLYVKQFQLKMKNENVSDFFIVKQITYGTARSIDTNDPNSCNSNSDYYSIYAFWNKNNNNYIQKFDPCGAFKSIGITQSEHMLFFKDNFQNIKSENVEMYQTKLDSITEKLTYSFNSIQNHSPLRYFWLFSDSQLIQKNFDLYYLETKKESPNINYESNNKLSIVKLNSVCEEIIDYLEFKNSFNRVN